MKYLFLTLSLIFSIPPVFSQEEGFPFGQVALSELTMTRYDPDTTASAVVLDEFGYSTINDGENYNLRFRHHVKIKILKKEGLGQADIVIPMEKYENRIEKVVLIKASSFNLENGLITESKLELKNVFTENVHKNLDVRKFAIPNVRVGSVIEYYYELESPFIFNFRNWDFQSEIPKMKSEYWASIPGVYLYNITLRGFLNLSKKTDEIVRYCMGNSNSSIAGGFSADCVLYKWTMENIPAFIEEEYMTARSNFISRIHFELSVIRHMDGRVDKVTREWKDADQELRRSEKFGIQLKKGKEIGTFVEQLTAQEPDELKRAKKVYEFIRDWYRWNEKKGMFSEFGIKKAFDQKSGNVGDINLSLIAALRFAGLSADPVILSTRENGLVIDLHPVLSQFNYVIARVRISDKSYLVDATEKLYPFGVLPQRCFNGKGRVLEDKESQWIDLTPVERRKSYASLNCKLDADGVLRGVLQTSYIGYDAIRMRNTVLSFSSVEKYLEDLKSNTHSFTIRSLSFDNLENLELPLVRKIELEIEAFDDLNKSSFLFNPFVLDKIEENPFKASQRLYPVDFGVPLDFIVAFQIEYPDVFEIVNVPERVGLSLPNTGGRYVFEATNTANKFSFNSILSIRKAVFPSEEYQFLKELFSRIIQVQSADLIFKRKQTN